MIDNDKRRSNQQAKEKVRRRIRVQIDPDNYEYEPERKPIDYNNDEAHSRVAIYVRINKVSSTLPFSLSLNGVSLWDMNGPIPTICGFIFFKKISSSAKFSSV